MATESDRLVFNGVHGDTGGYLLPPMSPEELTRIAMGERLDPQQQRELAYRHQTGRRDTYRLGAGLDARDLGQAGWGVVFAHDADPAVREALAPLLDLRRQQANQIKELYKEYTGPAAWRPGESKNAFLGRHGAGPGPVNPRKVPYYLLIVGDPETIPYRFQYELDVQHAVGRICFESLDEYAEYARSVVRAETGPAQRPRRAVFFGVENPDDRATSLSARELIRPLAEWLPQETRWPVEAIVGEGATKERLASLLTNGEAPSLLFTASHGMGFEKGSARQIPHQGALLCQDWPGPRQWRSAIPESFYLSADDLPSGVRMDGLVAFVFACFGAGTPRHDDFAHDTVAEGEGRPEIAPRSFVARLPQRLLGHHGALAFIGHVERAWGCSFLWQNAGRQTAVFESALQLLTSGYPVGAALEFFNDRYAELATLLSSELDDLRFGKKVDPLLLSEYWTAHNDARGYALFGDPAVRLPAGA